MNENPIHIHMKKTKTMNNKKKSKIFMFHVLKIHSLSFKWKNIYIHFYLN